MRFNKETLAFWLTVQRLFKERGTNFFKGYKAESQGNKSVKPMDCAINFIVPNKSVLSRESKAYRLDVSKPGLMEISLDVFAEHHEGRDVKLSLDGKRISIGFGDLGEEDLGGLEAKPALKERQERLSKETDDIKTAHEICKLQSENDGKFLKEAPECGTIKSALLTSISHLSYRVKELRELVVKKKTALINLKKRVDGDWTKSKLAPAISFLHTKIITSQSSIQDLLSSIDKLGFAVACINGTEQHYVLGSNAAVHFESQENYVCLREVVLTNKSPSIDNPVPMTTKQHSQQWHALRDQSRITGSTIFQALGCATLKEQKSHYDKVYNGKVIQVSPELQALFDYGSSQEINALATLLGKILPVYFPRLIFREDGCCVVPLNDSYAVISGDGSGINADNNINMTFEFKCPKPKKERVVDQHYALPVRYTTQVLAQMYAKNCEHFAYVCFTPESSTFIKGTFDQTTWHEVWDLATELYSSESHRPTKKHCKSKALLSSLQTYSQTCQFVAEFPSLLGIPCKCDNSEDPSDVFGYHSQQMNVDVQTMSFEDAVIATGGAMKALQNAYQIMRKPAKEVIVTVISDLERIATEFSAHAVPIQYGLSGFSFNMEVARAFINQAVEGCRKRKMSVKTVAFDGQFLEISVTDNKGRPLTVLQFMKKFWDSVMKMDRNAKVEALLSSETPVPSPQNITRAIAKKKEQDKKGSKLAEAERDSDLPDNYLIQYLPSEVVSQMDEDLYQLVQQAGKAIVTKSSQTCLDDEDSYSKTPDFEEALIALLITSNDKQSERWRSLTLDEFKAMLNTAESIHRSLTVNEMKNILALTQDCKLVSKMLKWQLANELSKVYGTGTEVKTPYQKSPRPLSQLVLKAIRSWPICAVNVAYAQLHFADAFSAWEEFNMFKGGATLLTPCGKHVLPQWYAQPSLIDNEVIQFAIDPHHLFVNNRAKCCSTGMPRMGIHATAWWDVAKESKKNGTGLSLEIAKELRDRQSNAFAQTTFSEKVENEMRKMGNDAEADWCKTIRNWYQAVDGAGIDPDQRMEWMIEIRSFLLPFLKVGHFPPPGQYVADMTTTQFEGILCNVDRRIQLYHTTKKGCYNQRTVSSLDSENFFGAFQVHVILGSLMLSLKAVFNSSVANCENLLMYLDL